MDGEEVLSFLKKSPITAPFVAGIGTLESINFTPYKHGSKYIYIVNTTKSSTILGHWVLIFVSSSGTMFFDSFGRRPHDIDERFSSVFSKIGKAPLIVGEKRLQQKNSCTCPAYCIMFAMYLCSGFSLAEILSWYSDDEYEVNDRSVFHWLKHRTGALLNKDKILKCKGV